MRILLDQGLPRSAAGLLREAGLDALHTAECGLARAMDWAILDYARDEDRLVITLDSNFHALLALANATGPSVIRIRIQGIRAEAMVTLIQQVLAQCAEDIAKGCKVSVQDDRIGVRRFPIGTRSGNTS